MSFHDLGLSEFILKAVDETGYTTPTEIQAKAIPIILMGRDLLGLAPTGTGKTAGFILPMLDILGNGRTRARMPRSLILSPTRELAIQTAENFDIYGKYGDLTKALLIGGVGFEEQEKLLDRGVDVLIATPGRLLDHFNNGRILLNDVKVFVIDEADRMMDMGFIPDIEKIASLLPSLRQTLMFSATMPSEIERLAAKFLNNPKEVRVARPNTAASKVEQYFVRCTNDFKQKRALMRDIIRQLDVKNAYIFCNRKKDVDVVAKSLSKHGFAAAALHGDMDQYERNKTFESFKDGGVSLLVCSDVAARGLDVTDVSHVFNFDVPWNPEDYVHRIGRTGRAGKTGCAVLLVSFADQKFLDGIAADQKDKLKTLDVAGYTPPEPGDDADDNQFSGERNRGKRFPRGGGRSGGGARGGERPQAKQTRHLPPESAKSRIQNPKPIAAMDHADNPRGGEHAKSDHRDRGNTPKGMGDHVPAFLVRK